MGLIFNKFVLVATAGLFFFCASGWDGIADVPVRSYHSIHPPILKEKGGWFKKEQCDGCHLAGNNDVPMRRENCEKCHSAESYPNGQPLFAQESPRSCTWCHNRTPYVRDRARGEWTELHAKPHHQNCLDCHNTQHRNMRPGRAQCIACHRNKATHWADAPFCYSCHSFSSRGLRDPKPDPVGNGAIIVP